MHSQFYCTVRVHRQNSSSLQNLAVGVLRHGRVRRCDDCQGRRMHAASTRPRAEADRTRAMYRVPAADGGRENNDVSVPRGARERHRGDVMTVTTHRHTNTETSSRSELHAWWRSLSPTLAHRCVRARCPGRTTRSSKQRPATARLPGDAQTPGPPVPSPSNPRSCLTVDRGGATLRVRVVRVPLPIGRCYAPRLLSRFAWIGDVLESIVQQWGED